MIKFNIRLPYFSLFILIINSQVNSAYQKQNEPIRIGIDLVNLDISVTDKHRHPVRNLSAKDFTVLEDGVPQKIETFTPGSVTSAKTDQRGRADQNSSEAINPNRKPAVDAAGRQFSGYKFISIAVDNTSVQSANRESVERALNRYLQQQLQADDLVAIYSITNSLTLVQPFTSDRDKLLKAVASAARGHLATEAATTREEAQKEVERSARSLDTGSPVERADTASRSVFESYNNVSDYFQAQSLFRSLRAIIDVQRNLTGGKSLILFSQGASLQPSSGYAIDGVISAANGVGVSIYVIDVGGLSVGETPHGIDPRGNLGLPTKQRPDVYGGEDPTKVRDGENGLERALKRTLANAQPDRVGVLARLSDQTGGIAVTNNNDLSAGLTLIDTDLRAHYVITYLPSNHDFDGRFRQITVKVANPDVMVRTRRGYYAVKTETAITEDAPVRKLASEMLVGAESAFPLEMSVSHFPRGAAYLVPVTIKVPGTAISTQKKGDRYYADLDFVMTVKDSAGAVVSSFGRSYPLELNEDQYKELGAAALPIRHNVRLTPGTYIISTALRDRPSGRTSFSRKGVSLPVLSDGPHLSSLLLARQTEQLSDDYPASQLARDVLAFGHNRVVMPTDTRFTRAETLLLFFRVYAPPASAAHPSLAVAAGFFKAGKLAHRTPTIRVTQPASLEAGFPIATPFQLSDLEPGEYTVRVELVDEATNQKETREARFTLLERL